jgi:hypothetical protein
MQYQDNLGAEKVALSAAELTELDKFTEPTALPELVLGFCDRYCGA